MSETTGSLLASHLLIVSECDGERDYEICHPEGCPTEPDDDFVIGGSFHTCDVGQLWVGAGHDGIPDVEELTPGRYPIRVHVEHTPSLPTNGGEEWDAWIEVVAE